MKTSPTRTSLTRLATQPLWTALALTATFFSAGPAQAELFISAEEVSDSPVSTPKPGDPFVIAQTAQPTPFSDTQEIRGPGAILFTYEAFSLPIKEAAEARRTTTSDAMFYQEAKKGKAEQLCYIRAMSDRQVATKSTVDFSYPIVKEPAESAKKPTNEATAEPNPSPASGAQVLLTGFESRNLGDEIILTPKLQEDGTVFIDYEIRRTVLQGTRLWTQGSLTVERPIFGQQSLRSEVLLPRGSPSLLGTLNPSYNEGTSEAKEQRVWFCFMTATFMPARKAK